MQKETNQLKWSSEKSILVLRELDRSGYYGEAGIYSAFATKFEDKFGNILGEENLITNTSRPSNRFARRAIEVGGTPFQPTANPSSILSNTSNKTFKQASEFEVNMSENAPRFSAAAFQVKQEREMETVRQQVSDKAIRAAEKKI